MDTFVDEPVLQPALPNPLRTEDSQPESKPPAQDPPVPSCKPEPSNQSQVVRQHNHGNRKGNQGNKPQRQGTGQGPKAKPTLLQKVICPTKLFELAI